MEENKQLKRKRQGKLSGVRWNAAKFFLTYSQCNVEKKHVQQVLTTRCGKMREYFIVREHHKDGEPHIHALVNFEKKIDSTNGQLFDVSGFHPNVVSIKSKTDWFTRIKYCQKEDKDPEQLLIEVDNKEQKNKELYDLIMSEGVDHMVKTSKISPYVYNNLKKMEQAHKEAIAVDNREDFPAIIENPWMDPFKVNTDLKKCHLWVYSRQPNLGKTTWLEGMHQNFNCGYWNLSEEFQPQILSTTQAVLLDEYRGQLTISKLNQLCDGTIFIKAKGKNAWRLEQKPIVIVCSNKSIQECYHQSDVSFVEARFQEFEVIDFRTS